MNGRRLTEDEKETVWRFLELKHAVPFAAGLNAANGTESYDDEAGAMPQKVEEWLIEGQKLRNQGPLRRGGVGEGDMPGPEDSESSVTQL